MRYAYQDLEAQPGTNASSPYSGYDTGYINKNHNVLGSLTHVFSPTLTSQTKVSWSKVYGDQPLNGDPQPDALHEPDDGGAPPGLPDRASPATCRGAPAARSRSAARRSSSPSTRTSTG